MTRYERTLQLEKRKNIATGIAAVAIIGAMLGGCFYVSANADREIDLSVNENEVVEAVATVPEVEEFELACVEVDMVEAPLEEEEIEEVLETEELEEVETDATATEKASDKEVMEMAHMIWAECGSCGDEAMYATGSVIWNRVQSKKYPNTIHKVLTERHKSKGKWVYQYSPAKNNKYMKNKPSKRCIEIARDIIENGNTTLPSNYFGQASKSVFSKYGNSKDYKKIGNIYFFSLK